MEVLHLMQHDVLRRDRNYTQVLQKSLTPSCAIIGAVGSASIIIIGLSNWLGKVWATRIYEKERKKHEQELKEFQNKLDIKLAKFNNELDRLGHQNKLRFTMLHEQRMTIIKELYTKLVDLQDYLNIFVKDIKNGGIKTNKKDALINYEFLSRSIPDFMNYTNSNRIFFSKEIISNIREIEAIIMLIMDMNRKIIKEQDWENNDIDKWHEVMENMTQKEIQKLGKNLKKNLEIY